MIQEITTEEFYSILFAKKNIEIPKETNNKLQNNFNFLKEFSTQKIIYGINTGFGPMAQYRIDDQFLNALQYNIIRSHATGAGKPLDTIYVRAAMITRLANLIQGKSGIHPELVSLLSAFINKEIYPYVPEHGSVGASGDLVQLAHIALALIGEGEVFYKGELKSTDKVLKENNLSPLNLHIREGLSVTNGTSVMTGIGMVNNFYAQRILHWSVVASCMVNEVASSYDDFMSEELNQTKHHKGQQKIAKLMRNWSADSRKLRKREDELYANNHTEKVFNHKVQPYYSLRCIPQILGPVYDTLKYCEEILIEEVNSVCDNPIIDDENKNVYHGGNFHGDYISLEMDKMKIAVTKLTMLSERQLNYLLHDKINEILPPFCNLGQIGLNYGMQASQFTATSTTAESQTLSNPMYVHSIPSNNDNQDIVSMGTNAALMTKTVIENAYQVMAILFMSIVQSIDYLKCQQEISSNSQKIYHEIRNIFPVFTEDQPKYKEIGSIIEYLKNTPIESQLQ